MDEIVHDYLNGSTLREVASKFNVSKEAISRVLRESNITLRPSGARKTYTINENFFDIIDTEEKAYVLGLIYSDGSVYKRGNIHCIAIRLQEDDKDLLEKVALAMGTNKLPMYISPRRDRYSTKGQYALDIKNKKLTERLLDMNVKDKDNIPDIPKNLYHHFIRGFTATQHRQRPPHVCLSTA
jgi:intein-encoded DNA endonuclease-like protein